MAFSQIILVCLILVISGFLAYSSAYDGQLPNFDNKSNEFSSYNLRETKTVNLPDGVTVNCTRIPGTNSYSISAAKRDSILESGDEFSSETPLNSNKHNRRKRHPFASFFGAEFDKVINNAFSLLDNAINEARQEVEKYEDICRKAFAEQKTNSFKSSSGGGNDDDVKSKNN